MKGIPKYLTKMKSSTVEVVVHIFHFLTTKKPHIYGTLYLLLIPLYALFYTYIPQATLDFQSHEEGFISNLYFSVITITTLGYGDILPVGKVSQLLTSSESVLGITLIGLFLNSLSHQHAEEIHEFEKKRFAEEQFVKELPLKIAAYSDVMRLISQIQRFWIKIHRSTMSVPPPNNAKEFFSIEHILVISVRLDLDKPAPNENKIWWHYFDEEQKKMSRKVPSILDRYASIIDPKIFSMLSDLLNDGMLADKYMIYQRQPGQEHLVNGKAGSTRLSSNVTAPNYTFSHLAELHTWCEEQVEIFEARGINWLDKVHSFETFSRQKFDANPQSLFDDKKASQQVEHGLIPSWSDMYGPRRNKPGNEFLKEMGEKNMERIQKDSSPK